MFNIGDKVVYPMHGAGTIESIEEKEMFGDKSEYYIIKMPMNGMKLMVPTKTATNVGVREVSDGSVTEEVFKILEKPKQEYVHENNWSKRYRANVDKIKSGDTIFNIAKKFSSDTNRILFANPNLNVYNLKIGQEILVPFGEVVPTNTSYTSEILRMNIDKLHAVAAVLLEKEKIDGEEFDQIFKQ